MIIGLGNPGEEYEHTRHNVGFMVLDRIAQRANVRFKRHLFHKAHIAQTTIGETEVILAKPRTFMNKSGVCVRSLLQGHKISLRDCLVVYDDTDLELGALRFRTRGSSGGHRGMASIVECLSTQEIQRLRVGIGKSEAQDLSEYVLTDFSSFEKDVIEESLTEAADACHDWILEGNGYVMQKYNRKGYSEE